MTGHVITHEPGSLRRLGHWGEPNKTWGTIEEQIADATRANAEQWSRRGHDTMQLFMMEDDCPHTNPDEDDRYDGVDDLIDEWLASIGLSGIRWTSRDDTERQLYWKNRQRAGTVIPLVGEWWRAEEEYGANHNRVCLLNPMGTACSDPDCHEGDDDFGIESGGCRLQERAREAWDEFWWSVGADD